MERLAGEEQRRLTAQPEERAVDDAPPAVEDVGEDRVADGGEVDTDLMGAAGLRRDLQKRRLAETLEDLVAGDGIAARGVIAADRHPSR